MKDVMNKKGGTKNLSNVIIPKNIYGGSYDGEFS